MTMVITKFNKLIANKFIWIGFVFLIVVSFAFMGATGSGQARDAADRAAAGTLFGERISGEQFHRAYVHSYMALVLAVGQAVPVNTELRAELEEEAWRRLAALKTGHRLGLRTSDREVIEAIRSYPVFQENGTFSPDYYRGFVQNYLASMGFSAGQFEEYVAEELVLEKVRRMVAESVLIPPEEVDRVLRQYTDEWTVQYVVLDDEAVPTVPAVEEDEVAAFFEAHAERFTLPAKVQVQFVRFPIEDYLDRVEITEEQAQAHYDRNLNRYTVVETIEPEPREGDDEEERDEDDVFEITRTLDFEEARDRIVAELHRTAAARMAADDAMAFVMLLMPGRDGDAPGFAEVAEAVERPVETVAPFAREQAPPEIDAGPRFVEAAFRLRPGADYYFSDPVEGDDYFYVLALEEQIPARIPELDEVLEQVRAAAQEQAQQEALYELAVSFQTAAFEDLEAGRTFADTAEAFVVTLEEPEPFSAFTGLAAGPYGSALTRAVDGYQPGDVTEPLAANGAYLVAYVVDRTETDTQDFAMFRPQILQSLRQQQRSVLYAEWQEQLLREADFTSRTTERPADEEAEPDQDPA